jgi:hypothetical protein
MNNTSFLPWPYFAQDEIDAATKILQSGKVNYWKGTEGVLFEEEFANFTGTKYAIALANGTVALELALYAYGIEQGDEVIVTSRTFIASASCIVMRDAIPVMADVDSVSQNITASTIEPFLTLKTRAIIAVHLAGWPCDMDSIMELARKYGLKVIEDCAQAHGSTYKGRRVGSLGHVAAFSFCQDKIISTAGEGGMLTTNDPAVWEKAWSYRDHGKNYRAVHSPHQDTNYRWVHDSFGTNLRMTEIQSAIGRLQLRKLLGWLQKRRAHAEHLTRDFSKLPALRVTVPPPEIEHAYYKYYVFIRPEMLQQEWSRDRILSEINDAGIPCYTGSCSEIYLEKAFPEHMQPANRLRVAKELGETSLMFLVHPNLSANDIKRTCSVVKKIMEKATR